MSKDALLKIVGEDESLYTEWKPSLSQINEIIETISGFSNAEGGKIIIGVSKSGKLLGVEIGKDTIEHLTNKIAQNTDPKIHPRITTEKINGKSLIVIKIKESSDHLVLAFGRPFKRVGKSTVRMSKDEYERIILEKHREELYFDSQICKGALLKDIDRVKINEFLKKAKLERRLNINENISTEDVLTRLRLSCNSKSLTNAAILLFGKNPQKLFLQAEVRCARFKGTEPIEFIDMKVLRSDIISQREDALEFIEEHIKLHAEIKGTERVEKWEYPIEAIREAITNAICHRDYANAGHIQIRIFDDRLELWGCGLLPEPLTPEDLKKKHKSVLRNPLIGNCFFLIKYIEEWGTGTNRIIEACIKHGLPEPLFEYVAGDFVVILRKYNITEEILNGLNERQQKAVEYLIKHKKITNKEYRQLNPSVTDRTVLNDFNELREKNIIVAKGEKRYRYYILQ